MAQFRILVLSEVVFTPHGGEGLYIDDFYVGPATGIAEGAKGQSFSLSVSPNPAKGKLKITFSVPDDGPYSLRLYDAAGRMLKTMDDGLWCKGPGLTRIMVWEPDVRPGVYFLRLDAEGKSLTEKLVVQ